MKRLVPYRIIFCIGVLLYSTMNLHAQSVSPIFNDADTAALGEAMRPTPSDAQLTDAETQAVTDSLKKMGYAFMRLKDVVNLKKNVLWSSQLQQMVSDFEDSTFIMICPLVKVQGQGALIGIVSLLGQMTIEDPLSPYVKLFWVITPVTENSTSFKLTVQLDHSTEIPDAVFTPALNVMQPFYLNKTYNSIEETELDVLNAMNTFLTYLENSVGDQYAPKYLLETQGEYYRSGYSLNIFQQYESADSLMPIYLVDRITKHRMEEGITWTGMTSEIYGHAEVSKNTPKLYHVSGVKDNITYTLNVQIISDDVMDVVLNGMRSVMDEALTEVMQMLVDSAQAKEANYTRSKEISQNIRNQMLQKADQFCGNTLSNSIAIASISQPDSLLFTDGDLIPSNIRTHSFLGDYINKAQIEHFARMAFIFAWENRQTLAVLTTNSTSRQAFKQAIIDDIGRLAADMIVQYATGNQDEMKIFLVQFIMQKVTMTTQNRLNQQ